MNDYVKAVVGTVKSLWDYIPQWTRRGREGDERCNSPKQTGYLSCATANGLLQYNNNNGIYSEVSRKRKSEHPDCIVLNELEFDCAPSPKYQRLIQTMSKQKQKHQVSAEPTTNGSLRTSKVPKPRGFSPHCSDLLRGRGVQWSRNVGNAAKPYGLRPTAMRSESPRGYYAPSCMDFVRQSRESHKQVEDLMERWDAGSRISTPVSSPITVANSLRKATARPAAVNPISLQQGGTLNKGVTETYSFSTAVPRPRHFPGGRTSTIFSSGHKPEVIDLEKQEEEVSIIDPQPKIFTSSPVPKIPSTSSRMFPSRISSIRNDIGGSNHVFSPTSTPSQLENEKTEGDDEVLILSEKPAALKAHRYNSLELENRSSKYLQKSWLNETLGTFNEGRKFREDRIDFETKKLAVLKRSMLVNDIEARIRNNLTLTDIIELEEPEVDTMPKFTREMEEFNEASLNGRADAVVVVTALNVQITKGDIRTLRAGQWLNDNIINSYMDLISARAKSDSSLPKVHVFSTFFYPKYLSEGHSRILKRWTRKVDIFDVDLLLFPIHLGVHWCLAVADHRYKTLKYYDSLFGHQTRALEALLTYMESEHFERKQTALDVSQWKLIIESKIPGQDNGSDCGVFTCQFAEYLSRDAKLSFTAKNMPYFRQRMIYETVKQKVLR